MPSPSATGTVERSASTGLGDVVELILDKGLVIDAFVQVSLIGIEVLTIKARVVVASVDTYLRYAEAINRLNFGADQIGTAMPTQVESAQPVGWQETRVVVSKAQGSAGEIAQPEAIIQPQPVIADQPQDGGTS
jgi:hypothetical protein